MSVGDGSMGLRRWSRSGLGVRCAVSAVAAMAVTAGAGWMLLEGRQERLLAARMAALGLTGEAGGSDGAVTRAEWVTLAGASLAVGLLAALGCTTSWRAAERRMRSVLDRADASGGGSPVGGGQTDCVVDSLVATVDRLREELAEARDQVRRLEASINDRVAGRVRRIESKLRQAEKRAGVDPLTGLGNRRHLKEHLDSLFERCRRDRADLSVAAFDLDHFKRLNDSLGHSKGDEVLRFVGALLRGAVRREDVGVRLGGDEFVVLMPGVSLDEARTVAERIVTLFRQRAATYQVSPRLGMSAGVASLAHHKSLDGASLLAAADAGLYRAKRGGKGCVAVCPPSILAVAAERHA